MTFQTLIQVITNMNINKPWWEDEYEELALEVIGVGSTSKKIRAFISKVERITLEKAQERVRGLKKPTHEKNITIPLRGTMVYERNYNQALEDALTAINPK